MFQSIRGPGRYLSNCLVQSGTCTWLLATNEKREMTVEQKVALSLRCDDAKMSLVVRKNEKVCAGFIQKV